MTHDAAREAISAVIANNPQPGKDTFKSREEWRQELAHDILAKLAEMGVIQQWRDISSAPEKDMVPFEIWWQSELDGWIPLTVSRFEGNLYPSHLGGHVDFCDRIEGAKLWRPITSPPPETGT